MVKSRKGWHVLYVKSRHEKKVDQLLKEENLDSYLPITTTLRQWSDRKKRIQKPLFPSYVFVNIMSKKDFHDVLSVKGVIKYVKIGNDYARVRNEEILRIKQFLKLEGITDVETNSSRLMTGDKMTINYGSLYGLNCEVIKVNNKSKVLIRIESLRQNITAIVPSIYLSPREMNQMAR